MGSGHVNGYFDKMGPSLRTFIVVASVSSVPTERFLVDLMDDDRLLRHYIPLVADMEANIKKVCSLHPRVFSLLALLARSDALDGGTLQQTCIRCMLSCRSFLDRDVFKRCRELPFSLAVGNIADNLRALSAAADASNLTAKKIRSLCRIGTFPMWMERHIQNNINCFLLVYQCPWDDNTLDLAYSDVHCDLCLFYVNFILESYRLRNVKISSGSSG
jgi:hypothetical protein